MKITGLSFAVVLALAASARAEAPRVITNADLPAAPRISILTTPAATNVPPDLAKQIHDEYRQAEQDQAQRPAPPEPAPQRTWSDGRYLMAWPWSSWGWRQSFYPSCPGCPLPPNRIHVQPLQPGHGGNAGRGGGGHGGVGHGGGQAGGGHRGR